MANLDEVKVGDKLALRKKGSSWSNEFAVTNRILVVSRITKTQVLCRGASGGTHEWRFRKSDGKEIGEDYSYAEIATDELIAENTAQHARAARDNAARAALSDLDGRYIYQLGLTLEQKEALAKAWVEIKAMPA